MAKTIFKASENPNAMGEFEAALVGVMMSESDFAEKNADKIIESVVFREDSTHGQEGYSSEISGGGFAKKAEGDDLNPTSPFEGHDKKISNVTFTNLVRFSYEAVQDAMFGRASQLSSSSRKKAVDFIKKYHEGRLEVVSKLLGHANKNTTTALGAALDLKSADGKSLFNGQHVYADTGLTGKQSNYFHASENMFASAGTFQELLGELAVKGRNFLQEDGATPTNYLMDTLVIPSNRWSIENLAKIVIGTLNAPGTGNNDVNIQAHNWKLVILPYWQLASDEKDKIIVLSSGALESGFCSILQEREPLTVFPMIGPETEPKSIDYSIKALTRFGVGHANWKHALMFENWAGTTPSGDATTANITEL